MLRRRYALDRSSGAWSRIIISGEVHRRGESVVKRRRVVVVEDEPAIRRGIVDMLKVAGYDPVEAGDGAAGLAAGRRVGVDLVLLDLRLPKMDGMVVLAELRKTHPKLPIIILTARGSEDDRVRGLRILFPLMFW